MPAAAKISLHEQQPETPASVAARVLQECVGDRTAATDRMVNIARRRAGWHQEIFYRWAEVLVGEAARVRNSAIRSPLRVEPTPGSIARAKTRAARFGAAVTFSLLEYELRINGESVMLKNATAEQVATVAQHYLSQGATMLRTGRWLERVAAAVPKGKTVGDALGAKQLERLQAAADTEAA